MSIEACLPVELQQPTTTITRMAVGLSGAGVFRVDAAGQTFVLKMSSDQELLVEWRRKADIQELAANAGLAPRVIHRDEARRAIVSAFVVDRSFPALFGSQLRAEQQVRLLGRTLRRLHALPVAARTRLQLGHHALLASIWSERLSGSLALPAFVSDVVHRVLTDDAPASDRALVLSHNDVNPTNLVYDGEQLQFLDWNTAAPNDPYFDLATTAVFLRMDDATSRALLAMYDGEPVALVPARFTYNRRLVAVLFMHPCSWTSLVSVGTAARPARRSSRRQGSASCIHRCVRVRFSVTLTPPGRKWIFDRAAPEWARRSRCEVSRLARAAL